MRGIFIAALAAISVWTAAAQDATGLIVLNPYVAGECPGRAATYLHDKLAQAATAWGMAGKGLDDRFVIAARPQEIDRRTTATIPQKTAVRLLVTFYIGDGLDGTLYSSQAIEVKGAGDNRDDAWLSALRKISPRDTGLRGMVDTGKSRITGYYDEAAPGIMSAAEAAAKSGDYGEAARLLLTIPSACRHYRAAQEKAAKYGEQELARHNQAIVARAKAAWSASPDNAGAAEASRILAEMEMPTGNELAAANSLSREMAARLKAAEDRRWNQKAKERQNSHNRQMALIKAAASVAKARYASRPKVVYRLGWW